MVHDITTISIVSYISFIFGYFLWFGELFLQNTPAFAALLAYGQYALLHFMVMAAVNESPEWGKSTAQGEPEGRNPGTG